ncbi:MAG: FAD-dependent oxidoreductase [Planctomycetota bacterium]
MTGPQEAEVAEGKIGSKMHLKINPRPFASLSPPLSESGDYRPVSYWQTTVDIRPGDPLVGNVECDVAIVGGGFTGLSTAYELKKADPKRKIVLIERTVIGHGASGRNGGFVMPLLGWDLVDAARKLTPEIAADAYRLMYDAIAHLKELVEVERLDCDWEDSGYLLLATCARREARMRRECEMAHYMGFKHQWIERDALGEFIRSSQFRSGLFDPKPATLNPAKLARALLERVRSLGVGSL